MITPVWGEAYIERWLSLCVASMRSEGNLSCLQQSFDFEWAILSKQADIDRMQRDAVLADALAGIAVRFIPLDEFLPRAGSTHYGVPLTLAYAKAIRDLGAASVGSYIILMNADFVLTPGSMRSVVDRVLAGYDIVSVAAIKVDDEAIRPRLQARVDAGNGRLEIPARDMMQLVLANLQLHVTARIINEPGLVAAWHHHQIFWRVGEDCLAMRGLLLHPFCFRISRPLETVFCPVDYGFLTELCPDGRFCVLDDSDQFLMVELQHRHVEAELLRLSPPCRIPQARLGALARGIASEAGTWVTQEHQRNFTTTIYFHAGPLPADTAQRAAPFERLAAAITRRMSPPRSHVGHWHWLLSVRSYRRDMARDGAPAAIPLLDDGRNDIEPIVPPWAVEEPPVAAAVTSPYLSEAARELHRQRIGAIIAAELRRGQGHGSSDLDLIYIGDMELFGPVPKASWRLLRYGEPQGPDNRHDFHVVMPDRLRDASADDALLICAGIGFLPLWDNIADDLATFLKLRRRVILAFIREGFAPLAFSSHTHFFSLLTLGFPTRRFDARLTVYDPADAWAGSGPIRSLRRLFQGLAGLKGDGADAGPQRGSFSALIVTVERRKVAGRWGKRLVAALRRFG